MPETIKNSGGGAILHPQPPSATDAQLFGGSLSRNEWTLRGTRSRLFVLSSGTGDLVTARRRQPLAAPLIIWLPAGESATLALEAGADGGMLAIPDQILGAAMPAGAVFAQVRDTISRPILGQRLSLAASRQILATVRLIAEEISGVLPGGEEVIRHHLSLLLIALWRLAAPVGDAPKPSPRVIVRSFVQLVDLHVRDHWTVPDYAVALGVTPDRLNTAIKRATGRTPLDFIHGRLVAEAVILLEGSSLQIAEIADALGFTDAAYFSRFFKRVAGVSPRTHRAGPRQKRLATDTSYAAWP
ncbi:helix-turn-helix domain-containing protein [Rhizobium sp. SGZ-381]|uniref:helix-turn-helix domain-containing protein n=1 Tax=Rhizobium sp. SGZ-381 TaxID=3342800 RepID=UPI00366BE138